MKVGPKTLKTAALLMAVLASCLGIAEWMSPYRIVDLPENEQQILSAVKRDFHLQFPEGKVPPG